MLAKLREAFPQIDWAADENPISTVAFVGALNSEFSLTVFASGSQGIISTYQACVCHTWPRRSVYSGLYHSDPVAAVGSLRETIALRKGASAAFEQLIPEDV